eukprot:g33084.t1
MLVSSALVLMMTAPGLALFYGGLVRKKNILGVMMQCIFLMGLMSVVWALWGYSLAFGDHVAGGLVGDGKYLLLKDVVPSFDGMHAVYSKYDDGHTIPNLLFMVFQGMFFIITPALICGAFAERMKFSTMCVFMVVWGTLIYCPLAHWVWGGGWLGDGDWAAKDFAGGLVVHLSSGVAALVCALMIGKRLGFGQEPMPPHNLTYTFIGAALLWVGWFGFNAGSQLAADATAVNAFVATHLAAAAGVLAWAGMEWFTRGKPSILGACSGAVAGLVCITPACGFVTPTSGIVMGFLAGIGCYFACTALKSKFNYDDSLDAFGVHGIGGALGAVLTGVFATQAVTGDADAVGLIDGNASLLVNQLVSVAAGAAFSLVGTIIILKVLDATMGLRVSQDDEIKGLDLSQHGEEGHSYSYRRYRRRGHLRPMQETALAQTPIDLIQQLRADVVGIRDRAHKLYAGGATGVQTAAAVAEATDSFIVQLLARAHESLGENERAAVQQHAAVIAVGGSGRGDPSPYSDVDLLFLFENSAGDVFSSMSAQVVRDCWDAKIKLGHAVRNSSDTLALAKQEPEVATALIESRWLWGSRPTFDAFRRRFDQRLVRRRVRAFTEECLQARHVERIANGASATQLEPDVKKSVGGLRDLHLIRWIGYAHYQTADFDSLRMKGALRKQDARRLIAAHEFLTRLRCEMHFHMGAPQDVLTREEQLRIAELWKYEAPDGQRPVERFMKHYFEHSTQVAEIASRFAAQHRRLPIARRIARFLMTHRMNDFMLVGPDQIDVKRRERNAVCSDLEEILKLFRSAALYSVDLAPDLIEHITVAQKQLDGGISEQSARVFLDILKTSGNLGSVLRSMYATGVLELVIPNMSHARSLLQFNQYHAYTVDEHTLRTIEAAESLETDEGPFGVAYRDIEHKELLHLALLLHDLGKGFVDDHSDVGRVIAETVADRLGLPDHHRKTLVFLVHKHLLMSHLAFRRNLADPEILMEFARQVGSPEQLRMLFVLTTCDLKSVGPETWTDWKAELITELYDRAMLILSGKPFRYHEEQRLARIKQDVVRCLGEQNEDPSELAILDRIDERLDNFPPHYLATTTPEQIADDLRSVHYLEQGELRIAGRYDETTETVEYRVLVDPELAKGCFHKITGAMTAKRLEIITAQICTSLEGTVVDSFQVIDADFSGPVPQERIDEVAEAIKTAVKKTTPVKSLFKRFERFDDGSDSEPLSDLENRVVIDNESSKHCTVIDIFAHDRRGLLYTLTRAIYKLDLSVVLAKISTYLDQVCDVFYVTDFQREKIRDGERLKEIHRSLTATVTLIDLNDYPLPLFNEDLESEQGMPENAARLKALFVEHDGFLISCPEYNSSITPLLKNTIDWISRREGDEPPLVAYKGKAASLMAASPGGLGGLRGLVHVRSILGNIGVIVLPEQQAVSKAFEAFDDEGELKNPDQREKIESLGRNLAELLAKTVG